MVRVGFCVLLLPCVLWLVALLAGGEPAPQKQADPAEIARLIRQLGSDRFTERETASETLKKFGERALSPLREVASTTTDLETRRRAESLVRRIEADLNRELGTFDGYTDGVNGLAFAPDGRRALSGNRDEVIRLHLQTGRKQRYQNDQLVPLWCVTHSSDGRCALSGNGVESLLLWDVDTGKVIRRFKGHSGIVWSVALSKDDKQALSGSEDGTVRLWDVATGKERTRFAAHKRPVWYVAFLPDGNQALSADRDGKVCLWDLASGTVVRRLCLEKDGMNVYVASSPDGKRLLSGHQCGSARLWDLRSGKELRCFSGHTDHVVCVTFHPDNRRALSGSMDRTVRLWDVETGEELRCFGGHSNSVLKLALSPDGTRLLSGGGGSEVRLRRLWP